MTSALGAYRLPNHKFIGRRSNKQGISSEQLVAEKLRSSGWTVIPTKGSKSPIDLLAHHRRKKLWWGVQVKSSKAGMTFDVEALSDICDDLHFSPVLAFVGISKRRTVGLCMQKASRFYHVLEDGTEYHPLSNDWVCELFKTKIGVDF